MEPVVVVFAAVALVSMAGKRSNPRRARHMKPRIEYQPALDGVRAVAVAMVLLFHGGVGWMRGGYIGVSIFFTLSGYLITSLLLAESNATGSVRAGAFLARRARRLLPASAVCILGVALCSRYGLLDGVANLRTRSARRRVPGPELGAPRVRRQLHRGARHRRRAAVAARALLVAGHRGAVLLDVAVGVRLAGDSASRSTHGLAHWV